jgi:hypothetical protein
MSYRICRKFISHTFRVEDQLCKIFLEPIHEHRPGFWVWNVGFAVGKSRRQINDWYWKRKNKRRRTLHTKLTGRSGMKAIRRGFEEVLKLRWHIQPGDCLVLDCTSADPERQFHAWSRWHRYHPEWVINYERKEFIWYRPPYPDDAIWWAAGMIKSVIPADPLANTADQRYFDCFELRLKAERKTRSTSRTAHR